VPTGTPLAGLLGTLGDVLATLLPDPNPHVHGSACWAFAWLGANGVWAPDRAPDTIRRLVEIARQSKIHDVARYASWALSELPIVDRDAVSAIPTGSDFVGFVNDRLGRPYRRIGVRNYWSHVATLAALVAAYYARTPLSDEEIAAYAERYADGVPIRRLGRPVRFQLLEHLGPAGAGALQRLKDAANKPPVKLPKLRIGTRLGRRAHKRKQQE